MKDWKLVRIINRPSVRWFLVVVTLGLALLNTAVQIKNTSPNNQSVSDVRIGMNLSLILLTIILLYPFRHLRTPDNQGKLELSETEQEQLDNFRNTRQQLKKIRRKSKNELAAKEREFQNLTSPKGRQIASTHQIKVFERWIETPQGSCSIIGVKATPVVTTSYENLILENLEFSPGIVVAAGREARSIANKINRAAQSAERNHLMRMERIQVLPSEIRTLQSDTRVAHAEELFKSADESLDDQIKTRLKERDIRFRFAITAICLITAITVVGANYPIGGFPESSAIETTTSNGTKTPSTSTSISTQATEPPKIFTMPNIVGLTYSEASEKISSAGRYLDYIDVLENRSVWDNENWVVVRQIPSPGTKISNDEKICAGVTKISEKWRTPKHFGCWNEVYDAVTPKSISGDVMYMNVDFSNLSSNLRQYRATVDIDTDDGLSLKVMYCTEKAAIPSGKVPRMRLSGKYFTDDAVMFNNYVGSFTYSISKFESQLGNLPC